MTRTLAMLFVAGTSVLAADPPTDADRLKALEKQVAELKKELGDLREQLKASPKSASKNKLVGSWGLEKPPEAKFEGVVAVELKEDGTYKIVTQEKSKTFSWSGKYTVVGKLVELEETDLVFAYYLHIVSVDEKEFVLKSKRSNSQESNEVKLQRH
jgi:hypothetical protein